MRKEGYLLIEREKENRLMISDYDIVGTKFLEVFPLNLYRLDHGIGPCNVSMNLSGGFIQAIVWGSRMDRN